MPPKRKSAPSTPVSKQSKSKSKKGQTSIDTFFASPSKAASTTVKRDTSVISIQDSDSDSDINIAKKPRVDTETKAKTGARGGENGNGVGTKGEDVSVGKDEELARSLQVQYDKEDKGKGRATPPVEDEEDGFEIVKEEVHVKKEGINGSSSSKVHSMFTSSRNNGNPPIKTEGNASTRTKSTVKDENGAGTGTGSPSDTPTSKEITSTSAETVEAIDFDVDQFIFRPAEIDISKWPKGRLPYSVLVGVYVQVSSTQSRLLIVRVLTK